MSDTPKAAPPPKVQTRDLSVGYPAQPGTLITVAKKDIFAGASERPVTREQGIILCGPVERNKVKILPDTGTPYLSWSWYAHRLTQAFGPAGWALLPVCDSQGTPIPPKAENNVLYREYVLIAEGRHIASAIGECAYRESNKRMTWGDCAEGAQSNALARCCKKLSMADSMFDEEWREDWKREFCVAVNASGWDGRMSVLWRKKDGPTLKGEQGHANPPCPCEKCAKGEKSNAADGRVMPAQAVVGEVEGDPSKAPLTTKEGQRLHIVAKGNGWTEEAFKAKLAEKYKVTSTLHLSRDCYIDALDYFKSAKP